MSAAKHDQNKPPLHLVPFFVVQEIAKVLDFGQQKYTSWNWTRGFEWSRLIGAAERHLGAWKDGADKDPESGLSHLAHAGCCILFLIAHEMKGLGTDDRFKWTRDTTNDTNSRATSTTWEARALHFVYSGQRLQEGDPPE